LNKAIQAQLAPGSVFKIIMSTAGLQEGIAQDMRVNCSGGASFYRRYFKCWVVAEHRVHGVVDIIKAIYQSCDVFFYTLAERLGIGRIAKYAMMFGLGQKTGIDLPQEVSGVMPSEEWKIRNFKQKWYAGETISVGIGQGAVAVTPIQLARAIGAITSGGTLRRPHVTKPRDLPPKVSTDIWQHVPRRKSLRLTSKNSGALQASWPRTAARWKLALCGVFRRIKRRYAPVNLCWMWRRCMHRSQPLHPDCSRELLLRA